MVFAPERDDPYGRAAAGERDDTVRVKARAVHEDAASEVPAGGDDLPSVLRPVERADLGAAYHLTACGTDLPLEHTTHRTVICDPLLRHQDRGGAPYVRLDLLSLGPGESAQSFKPVGPPALEHRVEPWQLLGPRCDHELAADLVRDSVMQAELRHATDSRAGESRLGGARRVLEAGVQHAAVVGALVLGDRLLLLEHAHRSGVPLQQGMRRRQPDDATADDGEVHVGGAGHGEPTR